MKAYVVSIEKDGYPIIEAWTDSLDKARKYAEENRIKCNLECTIECINSTSAEAIHYAKIMIATYKNDFSEY